MVRVHADNIWLFRIAHLQINSAINLWLHIGLRLVLCYVGLKCLTMWGGGYFGFETLPASIC